VVKIAGKYKPIHQWLHLDALEVLPSSRPAQAETAPRGSRYDDLIAIFGVAFLERMQVRVF
jgi:ubiquitin-activating enzyme E1